MIQNIRYKLNKFAKYVYSEEQATGKGEPLHTIGIYKKDIPMVDPAYFLDIIEVHPENRALYRVRVYVPNGEIILGLVLRDVVEIHNYENLFDGRFNAVQEMK